MLILKDEQVLVTSFKVYFEESVKSTKILNKVKALIIGNWKKDLPIKVRGLLLSYLVRLIWQHL